MAQKTNIFLHDLLSKFTIYSVTDISGNIIEVNDKFCEITGYSREELIGENHRLVNSGIHTNEEFKDLWETVLSGKVWKHEVCNRSKDGTLNWFDTIITPEADENGNYVRFYAYRTLITEKKNQQLLLKRNEERYANALTASKEGLFEWDVKSNDVIVSKRWLEIMDCENVSFISKLNEIEYSINFDNWLNLIYFKCRENFLKHFHDNISVDKSIEFEVKTQSEKWLKIVSSFIKNTNVEKYSNIKEVSKVVGTISDITDLHNTKELILEQNQLLHELSSKVPGFFYKFLMTKNGETSFPYSSDGIKDIYEVTPKEVKTDAAKVYQRLHKDDFESVVQGIIESAQNLTIWKSEYRVVLPIKGVRWLKGIARPVSLDNGDIIWYGFITDITQTKNYETELLKAKEKAEESDRLKSAFIANMSHEIRTPMNGIIGFSQFLAEPDLSEEDRIEFAQILGKSTKRLMNLVEDIINISKLESQTMELKINEFNLNELLDEEFNFHLNLFKAKGIEFTKNYGLDKSLAYIKSDENKLHKILANILNNAYKFTEKGHVKLSYKFNTINSSLEFEVEDTGCGMEQPFLDKIFDAFAQEDLALNRTFEGVGLGLPIVKGYLKMLGGDIKITSKKNVGTIVTFTIPYIQDNIYE